MAKIKRTKVQNTIQKTKDRATRIPLKKGVNSGSPEELAVPAPLVYPSCYYCKLSLVLIYWIWEMFVNLKINYLIEKDLNVDILKKIFNFICIL
jgi:hypothetical protein